MDGFSLNISLLLLPDAASVRVRGCVCSYLAGAAPPRVTPLGGLHSVVELECLEVQYSPSWLMSILGGAATLTSYNKVREGGRLPTPVAGCDGMNIHPSWYLYLPICFYRVCSICVMSWTIVSCQCCEVCMVS
jgi:hypothetical protein